MIPVQRENANALPLDEYMANVNAGAEAHKQDVAADQRSEERPEHDMPPAGSLAFFAFEQGYRGHREHFLEQLAVARWKLEQNRKEQTRRGLQWGWRVVAGLAIASLFFLIWR